MTNEKLKEILSKHEKWLHGEDDGERADLSDECFYDIDLSNVDLSGADFTHATFSHVNLSDANLDGVNFSYANLAYADFSHANLLNANFHGANLSDANFSKANLFYANLSCANLSCANLNGANLSYANLTCSNLYCTTFSGASLTYANIYGANLIEAKIDRTVKAQFFPLVCPEEGAFIAWKKLENNAIAKLLIPGWAKRSSAYGRKCRASAAEVLSITDAIGNPLTEAVSSRGLIYRVGKITYPDKWDDYRWNECSSGIHFFITRKEAEDYEA